MAELANPSTAAAALAAQRFELAIELAIEGKSPYPNGAAFVASDLPGFGETLARYARERILVVIVYPDGEERILTPKSVAPEPAPAIAAIAIRPEHVVRVFFTDGEVRDVDLTPTLDRPLFAPLRDPSLFAAAHIGPVTGGLEWTDDIGLDPDVIYAALERSAHSAHIRVLTPA